jgi:hypothetical protein
VIDSRGSDRPYSRWPADPDPGGLRRTAVTCAIGLPPETGRDTPGYLEGS